MWRDARRADAWLLNRGIHDSHRLLAEIPLCKTVTKIVDIPQDVLPVNDALQERRKN